MAQSQSDLASLSLKDWARRGQIQLTCGIKLYTLAMELVHRVRMEDDLSGIFGQVCLATGNCKIAYLDTRMAELT